VRKAISIAGGLKERASVNKIFIVRDKDPARRPAKVELDADIGPGDIVTIEESFF
jgi:polysaccharide export outer membrane protein